MVSDRWLLAAVFGVALVASGATAHAQDDGGTPADAAVAPETPQQRIERALALREQGQDDAALVILRDVVAQTPSPRAVAQLALAEQAVGDWPNAARHLHEALASAIDPWIDAHRVPLEQALAEIERHVGRLSVVGGPPGAEVHIDGAPMGRLPLAAPIILRAGVCTLSVSAAGYVPVERRATIIAGAISHEQATLVPAPNQAAVVQAPARPEAPRFAVHITLDDDAPRTVTLRAEEDEVRCSDVRRGHACDLRVHAGLHDLILEPNREIYSLAVRESGMTVDVGPPPAWPWWSAGIGAAVAVGLGIPAAIVRERTLVDTNHPFLAGVLRYEEQPILWLVVAAAVCAVASVAALIVGLVQPRHSVHTEETSAH